MDPQFPWGNALVVAALTLLAILIANAVRRRNGPEVTHSVAPVSQRLGI
jgi:hypothetical protein